MYRTTHYTIPASHHGDMGNLSTPSIFGSPEEHLCVLDPALVAPVLGLLAPQRVAVEDPEAGLHPHAETRLVLVEASVQEPIAVLKCQ